MTGPTTLLTDDTCISISSAAEPQNRLLDVSGFVWKRSKPRVKRGAKYYLLLSATDTNYSEDSLQFLLKSAKSKKSRAPL